MFPDELEDILLDPNYDEDAVETDEEGRAKMKTSTVKYN